MGKGGGGGDREEEEDKDRREMWRDGRNGEERGGH